MAAAPSARRFSRLALSFDRAALPPARPACAAGASSGSGSESGVGQEGGEFVAAVAADDVDVGAQCVAQHLRDGDQRGIAGLVAVGVVELLEVVDVEHEESDSGVR